MTATRDFDDIARAWLDLMPDEAPDRVLESVLKAVEATPQRRTFLGGQFGLTKITRFAVVAGASAIVVVAGTILVSQRSSGPGSSTTPAPSVSPSASSAAGSSFERKAPVELRSQWVADTNPIPALNVEGPTIRLIVSPDGSRVSIRASDAVPSVLDGSAVAIAADEVQLTLDRATGSCAAGDVGTYRWTASGDGLHLTLTPLDEPCATRRTALTRSWVRSYMSGGEGGAGVIDAFDPAFLITLQTATWTVSQYTDVVEIDSNILNVYAGKDPQGFTEPCKGSGGEHLAIQPGLDAFETYVRGLPGFTVTATDEVVGGYPARHLAITTVPTSACSRGTAIVEWRAKAETGTLNWILGAGDPDSMDIVALPDSTILLQLIHQGGASVDDRAVLDSIRFLDSISDAGSPAP